MDEMTNRSELKRMKKNVENSYDGFVMNYERYSRGRRFVFITTMDGSRRAVNAELQRPSLEFNVLESYVSRLLGEFASNTPSIQIKPAEDFNFDDPQQKELQAKTIEVLEGYARHILFESEKNGTQYEIFRDLLTGGYSSTKLFTDYVDERSMLQNIYWERNHEQTLVGFDLLAKNKDKSDGDYCYEIIPKRRHEFETEFPDVDISQLKFLRQNALNSGAQGNFGPFSWSFKVGNEDILMVCDYYEKKKKRTKLYKLSDGRSMTREEYKKLLEEWEEEREITLPPIVVQERETEITKIIRHIMIENKILKTEETEYTCFPLKFIDGNSVTARDEKAGSNYQMTRPYFYHAEGYQMLKNLAGQQLANELENVRPQQIIASLESINEKYLDAYEKPQNTTTLFYNQYYEGDHMKQLNPPIFAPRTQIPPEYLQTFVGADQGIMHVLGNFDANMADMSKHDVSGKAIIETITLGHASAKPFLVNYMRGLQANLQAMIDWIPTYYTTPRSLPVMTEDGKHGYEMVNQPGGVSLNYSPGSFKIEVEAGVSFEAQQTKFMNQTIGLANAIPSFGQFLNDTCLDLIVDNLTIRNVETMKDRAGKWMQAKQEMNAAMMEQQKRQPSIEQQAMQVAQQQVQAEHEVGMSKVQAQMMSDKAKTDLEAAKIELARDEMRIEVARILAELRLEEEKLGIEQQKADDKRVDMALDAAVRESSHLHDVSHKAIERDMLMLDKQLARDAHEHQKTMSEKAAVEPEMTEEPKKRGRPKKAKE